MSDIYRVCKIVGIDKEIIQMSNGYDTKLLNNASNLSTGQKQRLAIARSLLLEPSVLLCDELLSNIDPESKNNILCTLRKIARSKMVIFVTHQMEIISKEDVVHTSNSRGMPDRRDISQREKEDT